MTRPLPFNRPALKRFHAPARQNDYGAGAGLPTAAAAPDTS